VPIDVRITLRICLNSFHICIFISLLTTYVFLNIYTHFPPLPYPYTLIAIFICMFCILFYIHNHLFVFFFLLHKSDRHLCHGAYRCIHNPAHIPRLLFHLYLYLSNPCVYVSKHVLTFSLLFHIRTHLSICSCLWLV